MVEPLVIKYSYKDVPTIKKFSESPAFFRCLVGPFGSGKSVGCAVELMSKALAQKPSPDGIRRSRWLVVRNTYRQLIDSTIKTFHQWFPPHHFGDYKQSDQTYNIRAFEGCEIQVLYRALDRPDHVGNLLSMELTGCWLNEMREIPWPIVEATHGRVGRYPSRMEGGATWSGVFGDTNPSDVDSKLYKYFCEQDHNPEFAQLFMQPDGLTKDAENLPNLPGGQDYYKRMAYGKDPEWVNVYCRGQWGFVVEGRVVFPQYIDHVHCNDKIVSLPSETMYRGWDFGLTPACVFIQITPHGQCLVLDEIVSESMGVDRFSEEVLEHSAKHYPDYEFLDIGDPAGMQRAQTDEKTCFSILHSKNINIEAGMQTEAIRLESVRRPLTRLTMGKPGFQLHPRCRMLRKGFMGGYCYRRLMTAQERFTEKPDKNSYSHAMGAMQYPLTRIFGGGLTDPRMPPGWEPTDEPGFDRYQRSEITGY